MDTSRQSCGQNHIWSFGRALCWFCTNKQKWRLSGLMRHCGIFWFLWSLFVCFYKLPFCAVLRGFILWSPSSYRGQGACGLTPFVERLTVLAGLHFLLWKRNTLTPIDCGCNPPVLPALCSIIKWVESFPSVITTFLLKLTQNMSLSVSCPTWMWWYN